MTDNLNKPGGLYEVIGELDRLNQPYTDSDNAAYFAELEGDQIRFVHAWGKWIVWSDGNHWKTDGGNALIADRAKSVPRYHSQRWYENSQTMTKSEANQLASWAKQSANRSRIEAMVYLARGVDGVFIDHNSLDADPDMLHVANGRINLRTGEYEPSKSMHLNTKLAPVQYDPTATAPIWKRSLEDWHPDPEQRAYLQRLVGEAAVGTVRDHVLVIHFGGGANGKGTFVNALAHVFGGYFTVPHKSLLTVTRHEEHATVVASLFRARLAVASETERRVKLNEAIVKNLTGGDTLRARRMREDEWSFEPTHSLWLQTNHLPEIAGTDEGIWRRVRVVPWVESFDGDRGDLQLGEKLRAEAPGILNWIIQGALDWQADGLTEPGSVIKATGEYRKAEDKVARWITDAGLTLDTHLTVEAPELADAWKTWTETEYGRPRRFNDVAAWLNSHDCHKDSYRISEGGKRVQRTIWSGIGWTANRPEQPTNEETDSPF
jgi:putative DNA primase/helicase